MELEKKLTQKHEQSSNSKGKTLPINALFTKASAKSFNPRLYILSRCFIATLNLQINNLVS